MSSIEILEKKLIREKRKREILESEIEEKSRSLFMQYEFQKKLFNSLSEGIILTDHSGRIETFNDKASSYFGDDLEGGTVLNILDEEVSEKALLLISNELDHYEQEISYTDQVYSLEVNLFQARTTQLIFTFKNITVRKKQEDKIKSLKNKLIESSYKDGAAQNAISVLHNIGNSLTTMLNHADKSKGLDELSLANQLFKNCTNKINSFDNAQELVSFLGQEKSFFQFKALLTEIMKSLESSHQSINHFIEHIDKRCQQISSVVSEQESLANKKSDEQESLIIDEVIEDCLSIHQDKIDERNILIKFNMNHNNEISMERIGLVQVFSNLFTNAIEAFDTKDITYNSQYGKELLINTYEDAGTLLIEFVDNGIGIQKDILPNVFNSGFSTKEESAGFGLHSSANYMKRFSGDINIFSPGQFEGTKVVLSCPLTLNKEVL